jgi:hypothetical protein
MAHAPVSEQPAKASGNTPFIAWFGVIAPPAAWAAQLFASWGMGEVIACAPATRPVGYILGAKVNVVAAIVNAVLLVIAAVAGVASYRRWRQLRPSANGGTTGANAWLALSGLISGALFTVLIAASFLPIAIIGGCS